MTKDYYKVLQVAPDADAEVIQAVYRRLARKYHPDTGGDKASAEKMKLVNEAYAVLSDPASRAKYDRERGPSGERPVARASKTLVWQDDLHTKASGWPPPSKDEDCELDKRGGFLTIGVTRPNWMSVHDAPPASKFCLTCGKPLVAMCTKCDVVIPPTAKFCPGGGAPRV